MDIRHDVSLKPFNTFGVEVHATDFVILQEESDLQPVFEYASDAGRPFLFMGGGSNLLFTQDFNGLVIKNEIKGIVVLEENDESVIVQAGAGVNWHELVIYCINNGWGGLENLSLIPGTVGAAPVQNIGAYGVELKDCFHMLKAWDVEGKFFVEMGAADCAFGYRSSVFKTTHKGKLVIVSVAFRLEKRPLLKLGYGAIGDQLRLMGVDKPTIADVSRAVIAIRQSKLPDPARLGNAGSFFKNPEVEFATLQLLKKDFPDMIAYPFGEYFKLAAGWLIEKAGWKGFRMGDAGCHDKQALVLVNYGHATGSEIVSLAKRIQDSVLAKFGVALTPEVNII
jgi:UDP-N-acetylmuramate dehydrogenase